ncbi:SDR family NAD(P)-dependent oxidoreductase [Rathayibacter tanaceti]|nr:SDR family NAD(P)-dependent oxidoreductase [Rathayibacter tanaceti]
MAGVVLDGDDDRDAPVIHPSSQRDRRRERAHRHTSRPRPGPVVRLLRRRDSYWDRNGSSIAPAAGGSAAPKGTGDDLPRGPRDGQTTRTIVAASDSGIGRATTVALVDAGMDVGITWHSDEEGEEDTAEEVRSHGCHGEIAPGHHRARPAGDVIDDVADRLGGLDVFVANAGGGGMRLTGPLADSHLRQDDWWDA